MAAAGELGAFLRARRARVLPTDVGLPEGIGFRRTPGLRREELAALAGVSIDYYTRLEQGREKNPSSEVLDALAGALLLHDDARAHLFALADHAAGRGPRRRRVPDRSVRPGVRLLLESLRPCPAYVLSPTSDILAANPETLLLFAGLADWPAPRRNTIRYVFSHPAAPALFADWDDAATSAVANLRAALADDPDSAEVAGLVDELAAQSAEFAERWNRHDAARRRGGQKTFRHPAVGTLTLHHEVLRLGEGGRRLTVYQAAPGSPDHDALTLLAMGAKPRNV